MGLPAFSINFEYLQDPNDHKTDVDVTRDVFDHAGRISADIGASFDPNFNDPAVVRKNKKLVDQMIDEYRLGARIRRWWNKTEPQMNPTEVVRTITASQPIIKLQDYHSFEEWAELLLAAIDNETDRKLCVYVWRPVWKTISFWLYFSRDEKGALIIDGILISIEAYEDKSLRAPMVDCMSRLQGTGQFVAR